MKKINLVSNIIINDEDKILLIYKDTSKRVYPISGKLEENENWLQGAKREIFEETTLKAVNTSYITKSSQYFENDKEIQTQWFLTTWFNGTVVEDYREGKIFWQDIETIDEVDLLEGDKQIIIDFLTDQVKESYDFKYDENRYLIND